MHVFDKVKEVLQQAEAYAQELPPMPELPPAPQGAEIARWIDHTLLKPTATDEQIRKLCEEAVAYNFASVCLNPAYVPLATGFLGNKDIGICAVISFPLGAHLPQQKAEEARSVIKFGATEIDMVMNIGSLKSGAYPLLFTDIKSVVDVAKAHDVHVKVILENAYLTREEKIIACLISQAAGADFVKTSTGFGPSGATIEDVTLMRRVVGSEMGVKAAGGVRTLEQARAMIAAGATRIGASAGVSIVQAASQE